MWPTAIVRKIEMVKKISVKCIAKRRQWYKILLEL